MHATPPDASTKRRSTALIVAAIFASSGTGVLHVTLLFLGIMAWFYCVDSDFALRPARRKTAILLTLCCALYLLLENYSSYKAGVSAGYESVYR